MGALKYFILKVDARKNMTFNPKESIDFNGNTGPSIQYTYARIQLFLRRASESGIMIPAELPEGLQLNEKEKNLIQSVAEFKSVVEQAGNDYSPLVIANYTYNLVKEYNQGNRIKFRVVYRAPFICCVFTANCNDIFGIHAVRWAS